MDKYFLVSGFEGGETPFLAKCTYIEIAMNIGKHKDSEMFYALKELHGDMLTEMPIGGCEYVRLNRDVEQFKAVIQRVHIFTYNAVQESNTHEEE